MDKTAHRSTVIRTYMKNQRQCSWMIFIVFILVTIIVASIFLKKHASNDLSMISSSTTISSLINFTTENNNKYIHFGFINNTVMVNKSFSLGSTIIYNNDDQIFVTGYINSITFQLATFFNTNNIYGDVLTFYILLNNSIISTYQTTVNSTILFQSFDVPAWTLTVYPGSFLGIGLNSINFENSALNYNNTICGTQSGNAYWIQDYSALLNSLKPQWTGEKHGVALAFDVIYNPMWNGRTPSSSTLATFPAEEYHSFGFTDDEVVEKGLSLNSVLIYNSNYRSSYNGYVTNTSIQFVEPFQPGFTRDGLLWLFVVDHLRIKYQYSVNITTKSLLQTFSIPNRTLPICRGEELCIGTYGYNQSSTNKVYLLETGNYFSNEINMNNQTLFNPTWNGDQYGIALSYTVHAFNYESRRDCTADIDA